MGKVIGIDFGMTDSMVAVMEAGKPTVIASSEGPRTVPSVVAFTKTGEKLVGLSAKRQAITNPENTIFSIKRLMGRRFNEEEVQRNKKIFPFQLVEGPYGDVRVKVKNEIYSPPEIAAMILAKMKAEAERYLGEKVTQAVITIPAYFRDDQRQAIKDAGRIAGLEILRIVNDPTAASLAYGLDKKKEEKIAVFNLGGGIFDISVLENMGGGVFQVKSTNGNTHLGGDDLDQRVIDWLCEEFKKEEGIDLKKDRMALQRLKEAAERARCTLSATLETKINLPFITADQTGSKHLIKKLSRTKLEQLTSDIIEKTIGPCEQALADAKLSPSDIDEVILVGGMTRMPLVQEVVRKIFGQEPYKGINPEEIVVEGAAIQAGVLTGEVKNVLLLDVTPLTLGIETSGGIRTPLISRGTTIPTRKSQIISTIRDNQSTITFNILQGEREMAADNKSLGKFDIVGIPPAPKGVPQIEVTFEIDANGIVHVSVKDLGTGKEQSIKITSQKMTEKEIEKAVREAKAKETEDKKKIEEAEGHEPKDEKRD